MKGFFWFKNFKLFLVFLSQLPSIQNRLEMNERFIVAHLLTASANLEEKIDDNESKETTQQREQFKEIAKNPQVAKALRFVNDNGPFSSFFEHLKYFFDPIY